MAEYKITTHRLVMFRGVRGRLLWWRLKRRERREEKRSAKQLGMRVEHYREMKRDLLRDIERRLFFGDSSPSPSPDTPDSGTVSSPSSMRSSHAASGAKEPDFPARHAVDEPASPRNPAKD